MEGGESPPGCGVYAGVSHSEMCDIVTALWCSTDHFEVVETEGDEVRFLPGKKLARWCWHKCDDLDGHREQMAREIIAVRKDYEGIE